MNGEVAEYIYAGLAAMVLIFACFAAAAYEEKHRVDEYWCLFLNFAVPAAVWMGILIVTEWLTRTGYLK